MAGTTPRVGRACQQGSEGKYRAKPMPNRYLAVPMRGYAPFGAAGPPFARRRPAVPRRPRDLAGVRRGAPGLGAARDRGRPGRAQARPGCSSVCPGRAGVSHCGFQALDWAALRVFARSLRAVCGVLGAASSQILAPEMPQEAPLEARSRRAGETSLVKSIARMVPRYLYQISKLDFVGFRS